MPLDIPWKTYLPKTLVPVSFVNSELVADPKGMVKKWSKGEGCDVTLIADDVRMLPCHREVLENLGGNVKEILRNNEDPHNYKEIQFQDMDVGFVSSLISYAYTGKVTITTESVLGLIDGSSKCQIEFLQERCVDFLIDNITRVDYLLLLVLADERGWVKLRDRMWKHCVANFSNIIEQPGFLRLTPGVLLEMLRSERLLVGDVDDVPPPRIQEKHIWEAVQRYIDHKPDERAGYLIGFLQHLRLPLMDREDLIKIEQSIDKYEDEDVRYLIAKAKKVRSTIDAPLQDEDTIVWKRPRQVTSLSLIEGAGFADRKFSVIRSYPEETFDDFFGDPWIYVTAMKITFRTWEKTKFILSSIRVSYSNGQQRLHGTEYSSVYEVKLDPEERIVQVSGGAGCMVDRLQFLSNKGRIFGPFGGKGGNPLTDNPPKSIYCHLAGISGTAVETEGGFSCRRLKFKWAYYALGS